MPWTSEDLLGKWEQLEAYPEQEYALDKLLKELCPKNETIEDILIKSLALNKFYSTRIYSIFPVAKHILELNIDSRLLEGEVSLVDELKTVKIQGESHKFYSFASKYCSHHKLKTFLSTIIMWPRFCDIFEILTNLFRGKISKPIRIS